MATEPPFLDELHDPDWSGGAPPLRAGYRIDLSGCERLEAIEAIDAPVVVLARCSSLRSLPALDRVVDLDLTGCGSLSSLDGVLPERMGRLDLRGCRSLEQFPARPRRVAELDVTGSGITALPTDLVIDHRLEVDRRFDALPTLGPRARLAYRGVTVPPVAVLDPESLDPGRVLAEHSTEVRRVMMELIGYDRFLDAAGATVLDTDRDPGGQRRLLQLHTGEPPPFWENQPEPVVCVEVRCPSTGNRYVLRVPPDVTSCRQAVAWIAGFDDATFYRPVVET